MLHFHEFSEYQQNMATLFPLDWSFKLVNLCSVPPIRVSSFEEEPIQVSIESITISDSKPIDNKMVNTSWEDANVEVDAKLNAEYKKLTSLFEQWQVMCLNRENLKTTDGIRLQVDHTKSVITL